MNAGAAPKLTDVGQAVELAAEVGRVPGEPRQPAVQRVEDHRDEDQVGGGEEVVCREPVRSADRGRRWPARPAPRRTSPRTRRSRCRASPWQGGSRPSGCTPGGRGGGGDGGGVPASMRRRDSVSAAAALRQGPSRRRTTDRRGRGRHGRGRGLSSEERPGSRGRRTIVGEVGTLTLVAGVGGPSGGGATGHVSARRSVTDRPSPAIAIRPRTFAPTFTSTAAPATWGCTAPCGCRT